MQKITRQELVRDYANVLSNGHASIFIGAGMSLDSGLPSWSKLLTPVAKAMEQQISEITDYYELAEQYTQVHRQRTPLIDILIQEIRKKHPPTNNHRIITRLPLTHIWTSNFDNLIEQTYEETGKEINVISQDIDFSFSSYEQVKLYKVHGCIYRNPGDIVITRGDIENYPLKNRQMRQAFESALAGYTFLFLGFSFNDVNFRTILGSLHTHYRENQRQHYAILKKPKNKQDLIKFEYTKNDLAKYGIRVLEVESYDEVSWILKDIERAYIRNNVFISGSLKSLKIKRDLKGNIEIKNEKITLFKEKFPYKDDKELFIKTLSQLGYKFSEWEYKLYSGFGEGVCNVMIEGAAQFYVKQESYQKVFDALKIFPLPHRFSPLEKQNKYYREGMIGPCGFMIITRGFNSNSDYLSGTMDEYTIAKGLSRLLYREQVEIINNISKLQINKEIRQQQYDLYIEKTVEVVYIYNRIFFEQWKIMIRTIDIANDQIKNILKTNKLYPTIINFITNRQSMFYEHFEIKSKPNDNNETDYDESDTIKNVSDFKIDISKNEESEDKEKILNYIAVIEKLLEGDKKYFTYSKKIFEYEDILTITDNFTKSIAKPTKETLKENFFFNSTLIDENIKYDDIFKEIDILEDFERLKAQRQIVKIKDFRNDDDKEKKYLDYEDYEKGIYSLHPFWYSKEDIDKLISLHETYLNNFLKILEKRKIYKRITLDIIILDETKDINKLNDYLKEIKEIKTSFQLIEYPYRSGTVIIPIGCLGGMAYKIWKEERIRFIKRFASKERFNIKVEEEEEKTIQYYLIKSYDELNNCPLEESAIKNRLEPTIEFLVKSFSPKTTEEELIKMAKRQEKIFSKTTL